MLSGLTKPVEGYSGRPLDDASHDAFEIAYWYPRTLIMQVRTMSLDSALFWLPTDVRIDPNRLAATGGGKKFPPSTPPAPRFLARFLIRFLARFLTRALDPKYSFAACAGAKKYSFAEDMRTNKYSFAGSTGDFSCYFLFPSFLEGILFSAYRICLGLQRSPATQLMCTSHRPWSSVHSVLGHWSSRLKSRSPDFPPETGTELKSVVRFVL